MHINFPKYTKIKNSKIQKNFIKKKLPFVTFAYFDSNKNGCPK